MRNMNKEIMYLKHKISGMIFSFSSNAILMKFDIVGIKIILKVIACLI